MRAWDEFDGSETDEVTEITQEAHTRALRLAVSQFGWHGFQHKLIGHSLRLRFLSAGYVAEVRGQSSATGHGKHGADPRRLAELRELEEPVLLVFMEAGGSTVYSGWLRDLPDSRRIAKDPSRKRAGWRCDELERHPDRSFRFPTEVPPPTEPAAGRLMEV